MIRDEQLKERWSLIKKSISEKFGEGQELNLDAIIYLIGVQELGKGYKKFKKKDKIDLMHIAICKLLEPYGYYEFDFFDEQKWPHYKVKEKMPFLKDGEQSVLIKEAIVNYFEERGMFK